MLEAECDEAWQKGHGPRQASSCNSNLLVLILRSRGAVEAFDSFGIVQHISLGLDQHIEVLALGVTPGRPAQKSTRTPIVGAKLTR